MTHQRAPIRDLCAFSLTVILSAALGASSGIRQTSKDIQAVDAATFVLAVQQGRAQEYRGRTVKGTGADFHGSWPLLVLTVGTAAADGLPKPIATWEEFLSAQQARTTLVVALNVAGFKRTSWPKQGEKPVEYRFSGVFNGTMKTVARMGGTGGGPDSGPCDGKPSSGVVSSQPMTYHCVPILDDAKIEQR